MEVDEYQISIEEKDGFREVVVTLKCLGEAEPRRVQSFSFVPAFAHALSDELCKASIVAGRKDSPLSEVASGQTPQS